MEINVLDTLNPVYTLSVASELSGIPVHSIRQYIDKGLIIPYTKKSKRHLFSHVDISRLKYIDNQLSETGLNIAGIRAQLAMIPCWVIRSCSKEDRKTCQAYCSDSFPCWDASRKGVSCRNINCRECEVYSIVEAYPNIKTFIKILIP